MSPERKKIAFVIGWGSVKCAASLGFLRVLQREDIEIDMVIASGGGSIFGSLIALGYSIEEIVGMNQRLWTKEVTKKTNRLAILQIILPKFFKAKEHFSLLDDQLVNERLYDAFGDNVFKDTKIPLFISATDYKTGEQVILSKGSICEAVRASIALPLIFPPLARDGRLLADGYLSEPLPVGVALQEGAEIILAMGFESISEGERKNFSDYLLHLSGILSNNLLHASIDLYNMAHHSEVISIIPQFDEEVQMFDTDKVPDIIRVGELEGEKHLPKIKELLGLKA